MDATSVFDKVAIFLAQFAKSETAGRSAAKKTALRGCRQSLPAVAGSCEQNQLRPALALKTPDHAKSHDLRNP